MLQFKDAMRAQYYLRIIQEQSKRIKKKLEKLAIYWPSLEIDIISNGIILQLADCLDQILLPVIAYEISLVKKTKKLVGNTPQKRYSSFFVHDNSWNEEASNLPNKYAFLFEMMDIFAQSFVDNICDCLDKLDKDFKILLARFFNNNNYALKEVLVAASDRHRGGKQAIILRFESEHKIIFKPTSLLPEQLFKEFVGFLNLQYPYDLFCVEPLNMGEYGWLEYIPHESCRNIDEIKNYYRRAGGLLAITDSLNYCDGHLDNLIAYGNYPVLIDLETLFHCFWEVDPKIGERSILFTGLIQKPPKHEDREGYTAAFQSPGTDRFEFLYPYPINERTDNLAVRFEGINKEKLCNCPICENVIHTPLNFIEEFIDGFSKTYVLIKDKSQFILNRKSWWDKVGNIKVRQLIRHTLYYSLLIRKIQQPKGCISQTNAISILKPLLKSAQDDSISLVSTYELDDLLQLDIPYFYHYPASRDLYDANGCVYKDYFRQPSLLEIKTKLSTMPERYKNRSIDILSNVLYYSSGSIKLSNI